MWFGWLLLSLLSSFTLGLENNGKKHWALLVAGSNGWDDYRHQADVCHAYQLLKSNGVPPENIITMMYDDVANSPENPFRGKLFNDYNHKDVYAGVKIDYRGENVTSDMFLRVLTGDPKLKEAGHRVVESGPEDNVFVYFSDHGSPNMLIFPTGVLHAKQLNKTLASMFREKRFGKMVLYIEACNSGSMFQRILPPKINVFAVTAANPTEPSWAAFCGDTTIGTCLADEFSYQWMTDTEKHRGQLSSYKILDQYLGVRSAVKKSHVMEYGDMTLYFRSVGEFQGNTTRVSSIGFNEDSSMPTRDRSMATRAHLIPLMHQLKRSSSPKEMELAQRRLHRALELGKMVRETVDEIVEEVTSKSAPSEKAVDIHEHLDCYEKVYDQYKVKCFSVQQVPEVSKQLGKFDRLCEQGYDANVIVQAIFTTCG